MAQTWLIFDFFAVTSLLQGSYGSNLVDFRFFFAVTSLLQGAQAHCGYLCQRSYSTMGEAGADHPGVPAVSCHFSAMGRG